MPDLSYEVDSIESVAEALRPLYSPTGNGKHRLGVSGLPAPSQSTGDPAREFRDQNIQLRQTLEKYTGGSLKGKTPEEIAQLVADAETRREAEMKKAGKFDEMIAETRERHKTELEAERTKSEKLRRAVDRVIRENRAIEAIVAAKGNPALLKPIVLGLLKTEETETQDGEINFDVRVWDPARKVARVKDGSGAAMTIADLLGELRADKNYLGAFEGTGSSGAGANGSSSNPAGGAGGVDLSKLSPVERMKAARRAEGAAK